MCVGEKRHFFKMFAVLMEVKIEIVMFVMRKKVAD
jgi:hypothetical protein